MREVYNYIICEYKNLLKDKIYIILIIIFLVIWLLFFIFPSSPQKYLWIIFFLFAIFFGVLPFFHIIYFIFNYLLYKFKWWSYKEDTTWFITFINFVKEIILHVLWFIFLVLLVYWYLINPIWLINYIKNTFFLWNFDSYTFILFNFLIFLYLVRLIFNNIKIIFNKYFLYFIISIHIIFYYINLNILYINLIFIFYYMIYLMKIFPFISKQIFGDYYNAWFSKLSFRIVMNKEKWFTESLNEFISLVNNKEKQDYIDLEIDKPIFNKEEDNKSWFWHYNISKKIYDLILWIKLDSLHNSYSIWIVWEWGIWKSWIINILKNTWLENRSDFIYYEFNPWNFERKDLIENFFSDLSKKLWISNISLSLKIYSNIISWIEPIKSYWFIKDIVSIFIPDKTLNERKEEINNKLKESNKRIVISIDDLDRCEPDEIIIMLNLIKNLWNFKNIFYIVSYDKENILSILKEKKFWENYLDKIINTEIYITLPNSNQIRYYFINSLKIILENSLKTILYKKLWWKIKNEILFSKISNFVEKKTLIFNQYTNSLIFDLEPNSTNINSLFQKENLRFIKKLLNQLNIIISREFYINTYLNKYSRTYINSGILYETDLLNILVIINYVKLKDYKYFNFILSILRDLGSWKKVVYSELPDYFIKWKTEFLKDEFFEYISWVYYNFNDVTKEYTFFKKSETILLSKVIDDIEKYS